jgi:NiFe hydrogenase small subunit HydA
MEDMTAFPGITRREFLAFCGSLGVLIGAGQIAAPEIAQALESLARRPQVVWSLFQECLGCSINLLQSRTPDVPTLILQTISLNYHEAVMAPSGDRAEKSFDDTVAGGDFYYVVEGAIATGIPGAMTVHGRTSMDIVKETYPKAKATICIGGCACYGNIQAAHPNPTGAKGVGDFLRHEGGIPDATVINIARCPGNAEDMLATLVYVIHYKKVPELDPVGRPTFLYGSLVHDNCERRAHFEQGDFITSFGDPHTADQWCWFKMGCKGPVTYAPCPVARWNGHQSWCVKAGPCIGCSEPDFWDTMTPFYSPVPHINAPGIFGVSDTTFTEVLAVGTAAAIGAHFVGTAVSGRLGGGGPMDDEAASTPPVHPAPDGDTAAPVEPRAGDGEADDGGGG